MTSNAYRERLKSVAKDYAKLPHLKRKLNEKTVSSKINSIIYNDKKDFLIIEDSSSNNHVQILKASNNGAVDSWDGSGALEAVPGVTRSNYLNSTEVARFVSESDVKRAFGRKFKDIYKDTNLKVYGIRPGGMYSVGEDNIGRKVWCDVLDDFTSYASDSTRFFYEVFDENGVCENKFICIESVTTAVGTNSDQTQTTIKIYNVPIYDHRHDTYVHCDNDAFIADVWFVNASKSLVNKKYSHIDVCKSNFTTLIDIFSSITYVNPLEIQTLVNKKLLLHSDHHFLPPGLTETELQNFIKSNWSQIYNSDYNYEFFHSSGANSGIMREVHNVKVERNTVTDKYRYTTAGKSKSNITPSTITVDSVNHTYTGTLSSSTYSGYKLAANSNKIVSSGNHTLSGYTGNNITLSITGNTVNVTNSKTSTNRTTELQNFIRSNLTLVMETLYTDPDGEYRISCPVLKAQIVRGLLAITLVELKILTSSSWYYYLDYAKINSANQIDILVKAEHNSLDIDRTETYYRNMLYSIYDGIINL